MSTYVYKANQEYAGMLYTHVVYHSDIWMYTYCRDVYWPWYNVSIYWLFAAEEALPWCPLEAARQEAVWQLRSRCDKDSKGRIVGLHPEDHHVIHHVSTVSRPLPPHNNALNLGFWLASLCNSGQKVSPRKSTFLTARVLCIETQLYAKLHLRQVDRIGVHSLWKCNSIILIIQL